jgi:hypothetical protein
MKNRLERERETVKKMIAIYCRLNHKSVSLCHDCGELMDYADTRLAKCPYESDKPACNQCPIHCYRQIERDKIKVVMRFSGPKMIFRHPYLAVMHMIDRKHVPEKQFEKK